MYVPLPYLLCTSPARSINFWPVGLVLYLKGLLITYSLACHATMLSPLTWSKNVSMPWLSWRFQVANYMHTTRRQGIEKLESSLGFIFLLFPMKVPRDQTSVKITANNNYFSVAHYSCSHPPAQQKWTTQAFCTLHFLYWNKTACKTGNPKSIICFAYLERGNKKKYLVQQSEVKQCKANFLYNNSTKHFSTNAFGKSTLRGF